MSRRFLFAVLVLSVVCPPLRKPLPRLPTVVNEAGLKKVVPDTYFFRGLSATTQLRNSAAIHFPDDFYVIIGLVDTSGYSSDIKAKYIGLFITEKKLRFDGGATLGPGQYGMGYTADGKFHIMNVAGDELLVADIKVDDKLARPQPLKIVWMERPRSSISARNIVSFTTAP